MRSRPPHDLRFRGGISAVNYRNCTLSRIWFHGKLKPRRFRKTCPLTLLSSRAAAKRESKRFIPSHIHIRSRKRGSGRTHNSYTVIFVAAARTYTYTSMWRYLGQMPEWKSCFGKAVHVTTGDRGGRRLAMIATRWLCQPLTDTCLYLVLALELRDLSLEPTSPKARVYFYHTLSICSRISFSLIDIYIRRKLIIAKLTYLEAETFRISHAYNVLHFPKKLTFSWLSSCKLSSCKWVEIILKWSLNDSLWNSKYNICMFSGSTLLEDPQEQQMF